MGQALRQDNLDKMAKQSRQKYGIPSIMGEQVVQGNSNQLKEDSIISQTQLSHTSV